MFWGGLFCVYTPYFSIKTFFASFTLVWFLMVHNFLHRVCTYIGCRNQHISFTFLFYFNSVHKLAHNYNYGNSGFYMTLSLSSLIHLPIPFTFALCWYKKKILALIPFSFNFTLILFSPIIITFTYHTGRVILTSLFITLYMLDQLGLIFIFIHQCISIIFFIHALYSFYAIYILFYPLLFMPFIYSCLSFCVFLSPCLFYPFVVYLVWPSCSSFHAYHCVWGYHAFLH